VFTIVINCSDQQDSDFMQSLIDYIDRSGAYLCMDEYNRIPLDVINDMLVMFQEKLLKHQNGVAVTCNPNFAGRTGLPLEFYKYFSRLTMTVPEYEVIV
jgi:dynein heavy chain